MKFVIMITQEPPPWDYVLDTNVDPNTVSWCITCAVDIRFALMVLTLKNVAKVSNVTGNPKELEDTRWRSFPVVTIFAITMPMTITGFMTQSEDLTKKSVSLSSRAMSTITVWSRVVINIIPQDCSVAMSVGPTISGAVSTAPSSAVPITCKTTRPPASATVTLCYAETSLFGANQRTTAHTFLKMVLLFLDTGKDVPEPGNTVIGPGTQDMMQRWEILDTQLVMTIRTKYFKLIPPAKQRNT